jgi:hypothetical protein
MSSINILDPRKQASINRTVYNTPFTQYTGVEQLNAVSTSCPYPSYITHITGNQNGYLDQIGGICSDGTKLNIIGPNTSAPTSDYKAINSVTKLNAIYNPAKGIGQIKMPNNYTTGANLKFGTNEPNWNSNTSLSCPNIQSAVGINGKYDASGIKSLSLQCALPPAVCSYDPADANRIALFMSLNDINTSNIPFDYPFDLCNDPIALSSVPVNDMLNDPMSFMKNIENPASRYAITANTLSMDNLISTCKKFPTISCRNNLDKIYEYNPTTANEIANLYCSFIPPGSDQFCKTLPLTSASKRYMLSTDKMTINKPSYNYMNTDGSMSVTAPTSRTFETPYTSPMVPYVEAPIMAPQQLIPLAPVGLIADATATKDTSLLGIFGSYTIYIFMFIIIIIIVAVNSSMSRQYYGGAKDSPENKSNDFSLDALFADE